jgi:plastocyanin
LIRYDLMSKTFIGLLAFVLSFVTAVGSGRAVEPSAGVPLQPSEDGVVRAEMTVDSYSYKPDHLIVPAGHSVELTLKSVTIIVPHNFVIKAPEIGVEVNQEIPAGKTVTVRFTPTRAGKAEIYCDKKLLFFKSHKKKGMVATLEVIEPPSD